MIGIAIITCNREDMYRVCIDSIQSDWYDELVTVNDGAPLDCDKGEYIETSGGEGVGRWRHGARHDTMRNMESAFRARSSSC